MALTTHNETTDQVNFQDFFKQWTTAQNQQLHELISASKNPNQTDQNLQTLLNRMMSHYEEYYRVKSGSARDDVLAMFSPSGTTSLENRFLWIGGSRPTMAFKLLYSKFGLELIFQHNELTLGDETGGLRYLDPSQQFQAERLQNETIKEEKAITEKMAEIIKKMAEQQDMVADMGAVGLSEVETDNGEYDDRVNSVMTRMELGLLRVVEMADDLRLRTLKGVVEILSVKQAVEFLISAAQLDLTI